MKKSKAIISIAVGLTMGLGCLAGLAGCKDSGMKATIWVSETEGVKELTIKQIKDFNKLHPEYAIKATVEGVSESDSATQMISDAASGADIFCFAQDQLARLVAVNALVAPDEASVNTIKANNDATAVAAATVGGKVQCYPLTSDNGYFMMYDKSVIQESSLTDLDKIVADLEKADKFISFEADTSAWYIASWFFGVGCKSTWTANDKGVLSSIDDDWNSDKGLIAMKGLKKLYDSKRLVSSSDASDFNAGSAVVITGTWASQTAKDALGDNFGAAELPYYTVDGQKYHLGSYSGNKLMGVKPQSTPERAEALRALALYLTGEECQLARFEKVGWGPSNKKAQESDAVKADPCLVALAKQNVYATPQGQIDGGWWDVGKLLGSVAKDATSDADLQKGLQDYENSCKALLEIPESERKAFFVIGAIKKDGGEATNWNTDFAMTVADDGVTWISDDVFDFAAGAEFKCRMGHKWDVNFGTDGNNYVVETAGKYKVQLVVDNKDDPKSGTITLVPQS